MFLLPLITFPLLVSQALVTFLHRHIYIYIYQNTKTENSIEIVRIQRDFTLLPTRQGMIKYKSNLGEELRLLIP